MPDGSVALLCKRCAGLAETSDEGAAGEPPWEHALPEVLPQPFVQSPSVTAADTPPLHELHATARAREAEGRLDEAMKQLRHILAMDPLDVESMRRLYDLAQRQSAFDAAWCASSALVFCHKATADEVSFHASYQPPGLPPIAGRLDDADWSEHLLHPSLDRTVAKVFSSLFDAARRAKIQHQGRARPKLDSRRRQDPATSTTTAVKVFGWASQVLSVPLPELYVQSDAPGELETLMVDPHAVKMGQGLLSGRGPGELAFLCARLLAGQRPELAIRSWFPSSAALHHLFAAGLLLAKPSMPLTGEFGDRAAATARALSAFLEPAAQAELQASVQRCSSSTDGVDLARFDRAVELTTNRAGLLLSGDLDVAKRVVSVGGTNDLSAAEPMKDLLAFAVSEDYAALRRRLGIAIGGP